ncbi:MAG: nuclease-related domain-containing protein [Actinomycetota bacterium]
MPTPVATGRAGGSARREYERRMRKRDARLEAKWGPLAGVAKRVAPVPQSVTAWHQGAVGEERLARYLTRELGPSAEVLNDRRIPGTKANIDHVVVTASGVWVIDAKNYRGKVETRDRGGFFTQDLRLFVGGRDQTKLVDAMARQVDVVGRVLGDATVPVVPCLCFVNSEWTLFAKPFRMKGVWITWSQAIPKLVANSECRLAEDARRALAERIAGALPPAAR